jgi:2-polyprenyl-3-methyl-5-hydroxy-6-metoxy-1,4-benzoquinol methylase
MINLAERSAKKEILDDDHIPFADIRQNMQELNVINSNLGGHAISIKGIQKLLQLCATNQPITICEIGCGGGDNLHAIEKWCNKKNIAVNFIGIDIKQECIDFAQQQYPLLPCRWMVSDYEYLLFENGKPDFIFSSLFCHHIAINWYGTMDAATKPKRLFYQRSSPALACLLFYPTDHQDFF